MVQTSQQLGLLRSGEMTVHLKKLSVGSASVDSLRGLQARRLPMLAGWFISRATDLAALRNYSMVVLYTGSLKV